MASLARAVRKSDVVNHSYAFVDYAITDNATNVVVTIYGAGFGADNWSFDLDPGITVYFAINDTTLSGSGGYQYTYGDPEYNKDFIVNSSTPLTYTFSKTASAQTVRIACSAINDSGYMDWTHEYVYLYTVPALATYKITYNANGGTNAPAVQVKTHGVSINLSSQKPSRSGWTFLGWSTSSTATSPSSSYTPGHSYTTNANLTLYAVWKINHISPTINSFTAYRCTSSGTASDSGTYARVSAVWTRPDSGTTTFTYKYKLSTASTWTSATPSSVSGNTGTSGTLLATIGGGALAAANVYDIQLTLSDGTDSTVVTAQIPSEFIPIDIGNKGHTIGVGRAAENTGDAVSIAPAVRFYKNITHISNMSYSTAPTASGSSSYGLYFYDDDFSNYFGLIRSTVFSFGGKYLNGIEALTTTKNSHTTLMRFGSDDATGESAFVMYADKTYRYKRNNANSGNVGAYQPVVYAKGTSSSWNYFKFQTGEAAAATTSFAVCYRSLAKTLSYSNNYGPVYYAPSASLSFPFTFAAKPLVFMTLNDANNGGGIYGYNIINVTTTNFSYITWCPLNPANMAMELNFFVIGQIALL